MLTQKAPLFSVTRLFWDDRIHGECAFTHQKGILHDFLGEIGGVIASQVPGRINPEDITIFDSTGIALQSLASTAVILDAAQARVGCNVIL